MMDHNFLERGYTEIFKINFANELKNIQELIYSLTKELLVDHDNNLNIEQKLRINFKEIPSENFWKNFMAKINISDEIKKLIHSQTTREAFKIIYKNPQPFVVSIFRARFPGQEKALYGWHQDEGTWYLSKNIDAHNKFPATLWLSINGADANQSLELIKYSHKKKLFNHKFSNEQRFYVLKTKKKFLNIKDIFNVETKASECFIFHPLVIHRSVISDKLNMRPRYSIDIRYFDKEFKPKFSIEYPFKIKKILKITRIYRHCYH